MIDRIGAIVRSVRERTGTSREALAQKSGVPLMILDALEGGKRGATTLQLTDIASVLSLDPVALLRGVEAPRSIPSVFLRHSGVQDFDDRDMPVLDEALEQGRALTRLQALLGESRHGTFANRETAAHRGEAPAQDGYRLAREVRLWLGVPTEPLGDLARLLEERFSIAVLSRRLETSGVTALCVRADAVAVVVLSALDPQRSQNPLLARVHLAHELCHALFDPSSGGVHLVVDDAVDRKGQAAEQRAKAFAAELLLPREGIRAMIDAGKGTLREPGAALDLIGRVRSHFGAPHPITANHLCNHGFIAAELRESLEAATSVLSKEPLGTTLPMPGAPSLRVAALAERAHRECLITDSEARGTLGLDKLAALPWEAAS